MRASSAGPSPQTLPSNKSSINSGLDTLHTNTNSSNSSNTHTLATATTNSRPSPVQALPSVPQMPAMPPQQQSMAPVSALHIPGIPPINTGIVFNPSQLQPLQQPGRLSPVSKAPTPRAQQGSGSVSPSRANQSGQSSPAPSGYGQALGLGQMMSLTNVTSAGGVSNVNNNNNISSSGASMTMTPLSSTTNSVTSMASRDNTSFGPQNNGHAQQTASPALMQANTPTMSVYTNHEGQQDGENPELGPGQNNPGNNDWFTFSSPAEPPPRG